MDTLKDIRQTIVKWAEKQSNVTQVWLFGSCHKGRYPDVNDIDIAIELELSQDEDAAYLEWCNFSEDNLESLQSQFIKPIDLQWYRNKDVTPSIITYVGNASELIYIKKNQGQIPS